MNVHVLGDYVVGRVLRIIPLYIVAVAVYWGLGTIGINSWSDAWDAILLRRGFGHLWTVPVEFKFYFVLPFLVWLLRGCRDYGGTWGVIAATTILVLAHQTIWPYWNVPENSTETIWYVPSFMLGCSAAICFPELRRWIGKPASLLIGMAILGGIVASTPMFRHLLFDAPPTRDLMDKFLFFSVAWTLFVITQVEGTTWLARSFRGGPLARIGAWSYSIYLFHWYVVMRLSQGHRDNVLWCAMAFALAITVGAVSYQLFEVPLKVVRHRLRAARPLS